VRAGLDTSETALESRLHNVGMKNKYYLITLLILIVDYLTKWLVRTQLSVESRIELIPEYLRLRYVENSGVAFGYFDTVHSTWKPYILGAMAVLAVVIIFLYSSRTSSKRVLLQTALAITVSGILGNLFDRIVRGYVVDFIEFHIHESFYWPAFNVADSAITVGIALLLIDTVRSPAIEKVPGHPTID
jgi:signal peptidase II